MNRNLSFKERLHRAMGSQEIENVKANHAYLHSVGYNYEEFTGFWNKSEDATWAHGFGRMVGYKEIYRGQVIDLDVQEYGRFPVLVEAFPELAGLDPRAAASNSLHNLASNVIEIADDGKTGRSVYLTPGALLSAVNPGKKRSSTFLWERYGSDFVFENGRWLYFHEHVCPDFCSDYGTRNWAHDYYSSVKAGGDAAGGSMQPRSIAEQGSELKHHECTVVQTVQNRVPWPEPYTTMDDENTYSPGKTNPDKR